MITSLVSGALLAILGGYIYQHESRCTKIGSVAATPERKNHESWNAVVDNYVFIHNAFRNDLIRIVKMVKGSSKVTKAISDEFDSWTKILDLHTRVEDELIIPVLKARCSKKEIPKEILEGSDHEELLKIITKVQDSMRFSIEHDAKDKTLESAMIKLVEELDIHLAREEENIMPLLLEKFSTRQLWAIDSFIINEKLGYCDKDMLIKITKWWFGNISLKEGWPLLKNFIAAGKQPPMDLEEWKKLQDDIPALQKFDTADLVH